MGEQTETVTATGDRETYALTVDAGAQGEDITVERWDGATTSKTTGEDGTASFTVYPGEYSVTSGDEQTAVTVDGDTDVSLENASMAMQAPLGG